MTKKRKDELMSARSIEVKFKRDKCYRKFHGMDKVDF